MSGRIRTIKPELIEDAITAGLSHVAFRLFIGCIILADDYGNLRYEPAWLRGQVFWRRPVADAEFDDALEELATSGLVIAYAVKGQRYGAIRNWDKHQKVSHPGKPRVPGPPQLSAEESLPRPSGESPETLAPDLRSRSPISDHEVDHDPEGEVSETLPPVVADAPVSQEPPVPPLDAPLPVELRELGADIVRRTGVVDVDVETSWGAYVAWLNEQGMPIHPARWARWVNRDCSEAARARKVQTERGWSRPRLVERRSLFAPPETPPAPYHAPYAGPAPDDDAGAPPSPEVIQERAKRIAAGIFR